jgi:hypothetical protein
MSDSDVALQCVQDKRGDCEPLGAGSSDVGSANIAATGLANVLAAKKTHQQIAERD